MADELETCIAAFFRFKGKDVVTEQEFKMSVTLELKWMSMKEAEALMNRCIATGLLAKSNGYLKPAKDLSSVPVPIAYKPSEDLEKLLSGTVESKPEPKPAPAPPSQPDVFAEMMDIAAANGIQKGKFVSECNAVKKRLGVEIYVAGLLVLRDSGIDIEKLKDRVYTQVLGK